MGLKLRWTLWRPESSVKFYKSLFKASSCVKSLQRPRWILSLPKSHPCFLSVPMSTNDHYFDNSDLTSHTTLPRASVADIDSLFLARPARAARKKGSLEETEENMFKQWFKSQNAVVQNTKTQNSLVQYTKYLKLTVLYRRLIPAQCVVATTSSHQGLLVVVVHLHRPDFYRFIVFFIIRYRLRVLFVESFWSSVFL